MVVDWPSRERLRDGATRQATRAGHWTMIENFPLIVEFLSLPLKNQEVSTKKLGFWSLNAVEGGWQQPSYTKDNDS